MSKSETIAGGAAATISVSAPLPSVEITIFDSGLLQVVSGVGSLTCTVPAGIYQIEYRTGSAVHQELVSVTDGEQIRRDVPADVLLVTPAPIAGTASADVRHTAAALRLSNLPSMADGQAQLVFMVRNLDDSGVRAAAPITPAALSQIRLVAADSFQEASDVSSAIQVAENEGWGGYALRLAAGMYFLRSETPGTSESSRVAFDQALYLADGWQTLVFVPNTSAGPALHRASIHMTPIGIAWDGSAPHIQRSAAALELALLGLQEGRNVITGEILDMLLGVKFENPMLGIVAAHAMRLTRRPDREAFRQVVGRLNELVPDHPDVIVLTWLADSGDSPSPAVRRTLNYPPMLAASYTAALQCDAKCGRGIAPESLAERVAPALLKLGPWMTWQPVVGEIVQATRYEPMTGEPFLSAVGYGEDISARPSAAAADFDLPKAKVGAASSSGVEASEHEVPFRDLLAEQLRSLKATNPMAGKAELARRALVAGLWRTVASVPLQTARDVGQKHLASELRRRIENALQPAPDTDAASLRVTNYVRGVVEDASPSELASLAHGFDRQLVSQISANTGLPTNVVQRSAHALEETITSLTPRGLV